MDGLTQTWRKRAITAVLILTAGSTVFSGNCTTTLKTTTMAVLQDYIINDLMNPASSNSPFADLAQTAESEE